MKLKQCLEGNLQRQTLRLEKKRNSIKKKKKWEEHLKRHTANEVGLANDLKSPSLALVIRAVHPLELQRYADTD